MSPTTTEQNELQQPDAPAPAHDAEPRPDEQSRRRRAPQLFPEEPARQAHRCSWCHCRRLLGVGWFWWESRHWESTDDAQIDGHIYPISARVGGQVIKVNFDDGQFVHKGDVLVVTRSDRLQGRARSRQG